jgi:hypothetical protein
MLFGGHEHCSNHEFLALMLGMRRAGVHLGAPHPQKTHKSRQRSDSRPQSEGHRAACRDFLRRAGRGSPPTDRVERRSHCPNLERNPVRKRSQKVSRQCGRGKNDIQIPKGSNCFLTGRGCGRDFLHPARQGQAHGRFRARQGSGRCNPRTWSVFW